jgi:N-methylhydantoinase A
MGLDPVQAAAGAFKIVNAHMADLIRRSSIDRGRDAREFVLFAYGGAGALHIAYLGRDLGIAKIYVPSFATVFSALGMLTGGIGHSAERSYLASFPLSAGRWRELGTTLERLESQLDELFEREAIERPTRRYERFVHIKYRLQPRAFLVPLAEPLDVPGAQQRLLAAFERQYAGLYGDNAAYSAAGVEIVKCRVDGSAAMVLPRLATEDVPPARDATPALKFSRDIYLTELGARVPAAIYDGERLAPGMSLAGPAVIERMGDTILLPSFAAGTVDGFGNVVLALDLQRH